MPLELVTAGIQDLNQNWPLGTDPKSEGDNHIRNIKKGLSLSFPGMTLPWNTSEKITGNGFEASDARITGVGVPTQPTDAARKQELDAAIAGSLTERGSVAGNGALTAGSDFSVLRTGVGLYTLTFTRAAASVAGQIVIGQVTGVPPASGNTMQVAPLTTTTVSVNTFASNNAAADVGFNFMRMLTT
jgi:hypothetical protein